MNATLLENLPTTSKDAAKIKPRAEFRVFGHGIIEALRPRMWNGQTVLQQARTMPAETYIVSRQTQAVNVKVRDGLLDIKIRTSLTPEGYEVFEPRGKFKFPVTAAQLASILSALKAEIPEELARTESCTLDAFLDAARRHADLVVVNVEKARWGFTVGTVICEYAQVYVNGALLESACVESEDTSAMRVVLDGLGLVGRSNVSYPRALASVVGVTALQ